VAAAVSGGVDRVQVRARELEGAALVEQVAALAAAARHERPGVEILVNRRVDAALAAGADGVHLGFDAMTPAEARRLLPEGARIGVSCHGPEEVAAAAAAGADYAHLAPIFDPLSKPRERPALGLEALAAAASHGIPVLAQGGIEAGNAADVIAAGAAGVAVTGAILASPDPRAAAARLRAALG
jgi:thiamine-phosphate pyrophosphorylase